MGPARGGRVQFGVDQPEIQELGLGRIDQLAPHSQRFTLQSYSIPSASCQGALCGDL